MSALFDPSVIKNLFCSVLFIKNLLAFAHNFGYLCILISQP